MATTAEETTPTLISSNIQDDVDYFDISKEYKNGDFYIFKNDIYQITQITNTEVLDNLYAGKYKDCNDMKSIYYDPALYASRVVLAGWDGTPNVTKFFNCPGGTLRGKENWYIGDITYTSPDGEYSDYSVRIKKWILDDDGVYHEEISDVTKTIRVHLDQGYVQTGEYFISSGILLWWDSSPKLYESKKVSVINRFRPFDDMNTSYATIDDLMQYSVSANADFNSFFLSGVTATSLTYTVTDGVDTDTDTIAIDCKRDPDGLLPLGTVTVPVMLSKVYPAGATLDIELTNNGEVKLGHISTNMSIDEGMTEFTIGASAKDYNDYTPDAWGNIEEGVKAKTKQLSISVKAPYDEFDMTYSRHMSYLGKFIAIDPTEIGSNPNSLSLRSLVLRGLILSINAKTLVKDKQMLPYYQWDMTFLEIV